MGLKGACRSLGFILAIVLIVAAGGCGSSGGSTASSGFSGFNNGGSGNNGSNGATLTEQLNFGALGRGLLDRLPSTTVTFQVQV